MSFALSPYFREAKPLAQRSIAAASIGASYSLVSSVFGEGVVTLIIVSTLDEDVQISLNGTTDFIPIVAGATLVLDIKANQIALGGWRGVYVKEIGNPTSGSLYVSAIGVE
jgi:hypothetical protein